MKLGINHKSLIFIKIEHSWKIPKKVMVKLKYQIDALTRECGINLYLNYYQTPPTLKRFH